LNRVEEHPDPNAGENSEPGLSTISE